MGQNAKFERYKIDSTQITDEQRKYYHVETLAEQKIKEYKMNLTSIMQFYSQEKSWGSRYKWAKTYAKELTI